MRIPLSWLGEFVELPDNATPHDVMAELVKVGLEEEGAHGGDLSGPIVVGEVLEFVEEEQSNGKTIRWCQVRVAESGDEAVRGIVCGARNFFVGDKVVVTLPGATLPGGFQIAARKTYGHVSDGMIASSRELGLSDEHEGILRLSTIGLDPIVGTDAIELLGLAESAAEVNVTPDRGYCLSIRGIAREYSHATGSKFTDPKDLVALQAGTGFKLEISDSAPIHGVQGCQGFFVLGVDGIDAKAPVPGWMVNRLKLAGMRSISIAVDITNYVMLELGQPLHAYDAAKLDGGISVRRATSGEKLQTLDEKVRDLHSEDLLICDESGPIGLAGVMGGARTEVSDTTTSVLLEAAAFDPISIARSARRHKLPSEASKRFERGVDSEIGKFAAARAAQLLVELARGKLNGVGAEFKAESSPRVIELPLDYPTQLVGVEYSKDQVVNTLTQIGAVVEVSGSVAKVQVPSWRPDLTHKTDLVEEVARLIGYDQIPVRIPVAPPGTGLTPRQQFRRRTLSSLTGSGFVEVLNYPFLSSEQNSWFGKGKVVTLENAMQSEFSELRTSLLPGLVLAAARNLSRGTSDLAIIEEGSVFLGSSAEAVKELPVGNQRPTKEMLDSLNASIPEQPRHIAGLVLGDWISQAPGQKSIEAGYPQMVQAAESIAMAAGLTCEIRQASPEGFHPGRSAEVLINSVVVGFVGELDPALASANHLPRRVGAFELNLESIFAQAPEVLSAKELRIMPAATQDLSLLVEVSVSAADLAKVIAEGAGDLLEQVSLVDDYRGGNLPEGQKSLTFALKFRAADRTLTQAEATTARDGAVALANQRFGATQRV
ncbi:MAG: phenylalanine--tRNA ligase subunit beta [Aquiluna sp.]|nr:phenylalanine--tRNA ligase subunit beta [Aquiluna sp.]MCF8545994.1 phenylalanine--tRNA ligase subunit beta [Aquiluna sp.]